MPTTFLSLPLEIRDYIWRFTFTGVIIKPDVFVRAQEGSILGKFDSHFLASINYSMRYLEVIKENPEKQKDCNTSITLNEVYFSGRFKLPTICAAYWGEIETALYSCVTFSFYESEKEPLENKVEAFFSNRTAKQRQLIRSIRFSNASRNRRAFINSELSFSILLSTGKPALTHGFQFIEDVRIGYEVLIPAWTSGFTQAPFSKAWRPSAERRALEETLTAVYQEGESVRQTLAERHRRRENHNPLNYAKIPFSVAKLSAARWTMHGKGDSTTQLPSNERVNKLYIDLVRWIGIQESGW